MTALPSPTDFTELAPGWTPERKLAFLDHLAQHGNVRAACGRVGLSREAAYRLRRRDVAFARGWAAAMVLARDAAVELLAACATEGIEHRVYYRGELVETHRRIDPRLLLAHLARLDEAAANKAAQADAARFDELLAVVGGESVPEILRGQDPVIPVECKEARIRAATAEEERLRDAFERADEDEDGPPLDIVAREELERDRDEAIDEAYDCGLELGKRTWTEWRYHAYSAVDVALERHGPDISSRTVSTVSTTALAVGLAARAPGDSESAQQSLTPGS